MMPLYQQEVGGRRSSARTRIGSITQQLCTMKRVMRCKSRTKPSHSYWLKYAIAAGNQEKLNGHRSSAWTRTGRITRHDSVCPRLRAGCEESWERKIQWHSCKWDSTADINSFLPCCFGDSRTKDPCFSKIFLCHNLLCSYLYERKK